jgi:hypothetical protein
MTIMTSLLYHNLEMLTDANRLIESIGDHLKSDHELPVQNRPTGLAETNSRRGHQLRNDSVAIQKLPPLDLPLPSVAWI